MKLEDLIGIGLLVFGLGLVLYVSARSSSKSAPRQCALRDGLKTSVLHASLAFITFPEIAIASALLVPLSALIITAIGMWNARRTASVVQVDVPIAGLPDALHGFTIAQVSDIHVGPTIKGPYVDSIVELRRLGLRVLLNEHVVLQHGAAALVIAGVTDISAHHFDPAHRSNPQGAIADAPDHALIRVLLAHQPRSARTAADAGFQLQLSGHTHSGQFWPWNFFVRLQQSFTAGLHHLEDLWVYVSRGTGYWRPPKRFGAPSEITHLRLVRVGG